MKSTQKEFENKVEDLNKRITSLLKEVASLSKSAKKNKGSSLATITSATDNSNNSSGTDSPSLQ